MQNFIFCLEIDIIKPKSQGDCRKHRKYSKVKMSLDPRVPSLDQGMRRKFCPLIEGHSSIQGRLRIGVVCCTDRPPPLGK